MVSGDRLLHGRLEAKLDVDVLDVHEELGPFFDRRPELFVRERVFVSGLAGADAHRTRAEDVGGEHIQHRGLVDRLHRVLSEQVVAPVDEVVDILHHNRLLKGA